MRRTSVAVHAAVPVPAHDHHGRGAVAVLASDDLLAQEHERAPVVADRDEGGLTDLAGQGRRGLGAASH